MFVFFDSHVQWETTQSVIRKKANDCEYSNDAHNVCSGEYLSYYYFAESAI